MWRLYLGVAWMLIQILNCPKGISGVIDISKNNFEANRKHSVDFHSKTHLRNCCDSLLNEAASANNTRVPSVPNITKQAQNLVENSRDTLFLENEQSHAVNRGQQPILDFQNDTDRYHLLKFQDNPQLRLMSLKRTTRSENKDDLPFLTSVLSTLPLNNSLLMEEIENIMPLAPAQKKERALTALQKVKDDKADGPSIEDIIGDIIHLLGGNVKPSPSPPPPLPPSRPLHSRINNRGPPKYHFHHQHTAPITPSPPTSRFLFPDAQDVSQILGLLPSNATNSLLLPSFTSTLETTSSPSAAPTPSMTSQTVHSKPFSTQSSKYQTEISVTFSSQSLSSTSDWLPVSETTAVNKRSNSTRDEPVIITAPIAPSTFDLTVSNVIGNVSKSTSSSSTVPVVFLTRIPTNRTKASEITANLTKEGTTQTDIVWGKISGGVTQHPAIQADVGDKNHLIDPRPPPSRGNGTGDVISLDIDKVRPLGKPHRGSSNHGTHLRPDIGPQSVENTHGIKPMRPPDRAPTRKPSVYIPAQIPIVRIDTCIVGDDTTCNVEHKERCATEYGVSSCYCRPGYGRTLPRGPCAAVLELLISFNVDRLGDRKVRFNSAYLKTDTEEYKIMEYEANQAVTTLFSYTTLAGVFIGATINNLYNSDGKIAVNCTVQLDDLSLRHSRFSLTLQLQRELSNAIVNRRNRIGDSKLYVERPMASASPLIIQDMDECAKPHLNDCSQHGTCHNTFGTFRCECLPGYTDKYPDNERMSGRVCTACSGDYCNKHGECVVINGERECRCHGNYIGSKCETDGEVLGVALGVSLAAVIVILLTIICLCLWSRKWKRDQQKCKSESDQELCSYMSNSRNGYRLTNMVDHVRWAHTGETVANTYMSTSNGNTASPTENQNTQPRNGTPATDDSNINVYNRLGRQRPRMTRPEMVQTENLYQDVASPVWETPYCSNHLTSNPYASSDVLKPYFS